MVVNKNSAENLIKEIVKLEPVEFLGICKILGVNIYDIDLEGKKEENKDCGKVNANIQPKPFEKIWTEVCDVIEKMNRTRRRNLGKLVYAATKKEK